MEYVLLIVLKLMTRKGPSHALLPVQSWAGSIACALAGFAATAGFLLAFQRKGFLLQNVPEAELLWKTLTVSIFASAVEALPIVEYDNLTVPIAAAAAGRLLFGQ